MGMGMGMSMGTGTTVRVGIPIGGSSCRRLWLLVGLRLQRRVELLLSALLVQAYCSRGFVWRVCRVISRSRGGIHGPFASAPSKTIAFLWADGVRQVAVSIDVLSRCCVSKY